MKNLKFQKNIIESLKAVGDGRNLVEHGDNTQYWYSISDMMILLVHTRRINLAYSKQVQSGEEYIAIRQNQSSVFLADPYYFTNFNNYLAEDVSQIIGNHSEKEQNNHAWQGNMPELIVIPLLSGLNWRTIAIHINYQTNTIDITWDDPYGNFPQVMREELSQPILKSALNLINRYKQINNEELIIAENTKVVQNENSKDQQGKGSNEWDSGPIAITNIRNYVTHYLENHNLIEVNYTIGDIGENTEDYYTDSIRNARISHIEEYSQVEEMPIDWNRLTDIRVASEQDKKNKIKKLDLETANIISSFEPFNSDMYFSILENYKKLTPEEVDDQKVIKCEILSNEKSNQPEENIKLFSQAKKMDQLQNDLFKIFELPPSLESLQENEEHLATFLAFNSGKTPLNKDDYQSTLDKVKYNIFKEIFYFIGMKIDDFTYNMLKFIGKSDLKKYILRYLSAFFRKFKKELREKKSEEILQIFFNQNLKELGLNSQIEIKKLEDEGHANDVYLVSSKKINQEDPSTIDYYAKTFSKYTRHVADGLIDPREALIYKLLEYTGFGPKCWFLLKSNSSSTGTSSSYNFIVTENVARTKGLNFLLDTKENEVKLKELYTKNKVKFAIEVSAAALLSDILVFHDTFNYNPKNYGIVYNESSNNDLHFQFIDHLPNASNGIFDSMKRKRDLNNYSPRKGLYKVIDLRQELGLNTKYSPLVEIAKMSSSEIDKKLIYSAVQKKLDGLFEALEKATKDINKLIDSNIVIFMEKAAELLEKYKDRIRENIDHYEEIILLLCK